MNDAGIAPAWPAPASAAALDDERLAQCYATDRGLRSLRMNFVSSIDGAATAGGLSAGLSSAADKRVFDILRRLCDAVLVGGGTVRAEGYGAMRLDRAAVEWRRAHGLADHPVFAIVSGALHLDPGSPIFAKAPVRPVVVTVAASADAKKQALSRVADVLVCGEQKLDPGVMLDALAQRGLRQVLCEGGPTLFGALLEADCVDELCLTVSPRIEAGAARRIAAGAIPQARRMVLRHALVSGSVLLLRYLRMREEQRLGAPAVG
jgi:riboflavin biosynthesis pyrimidine reductase